MSTCERARIDSRSTLIATYTRADTKTNHHQSPSKPSCKEEERKDPRVQQLRQPLRPRLPTLPRQQHETDLRDRHHRRLVQQQILQQPHWHRLLQRVHVRARARYCTPVGDRPPGRTFLGDEERDGGVQRDGRDFGRGGGCDGPREEGLERREWRGCSLRVFLDKKKNNDISESRIVPKQSGQAKGKTHSRLLRRRQL